ncbi:MAG: DNA-processing protein DprA [Chloroflexi bacterium]|nr:DNA-processing protein DprA [Chloroflexota bacterium]
MQAPPHQQYWLGLHLVPNFGVARISQLLAHFESAEALWREPDASLLRLNLPGNLLRQFCDARRKIDLPQMMEAVARAGASLITLDDEAYPALLRQLSDRPLLLYVRGQLRAEDDKCLAIVGTRKASKYGWDVANQMAAEIADQGITIVSGLAQGIDAAAHRGALQAGARTIALIGTGIDKVYPRENAGLAEEIVANGAIVSEMPLGTMPLAKNFPQRNRLISGMSLGVLVVEAPAKSGALNTVSHALDQGREVFAVPHNIFSLSGRGCNRLIQDGAKLVADVDDILDELDLSHINAQTRITTERLQPANEAEDAIFEQLGADPIHVDVIVRLTHLPTATVTSTLTMLELKGLAESAGPMQYCRAPNSRRQ